MTTRPTAPQQGRHRASSSSSALRAFLSSPMRRVTLRSVASNKGRLALTMLSVLLATAFISGSLMLTNSLEKSFNSLVDSGVEGVDVGVVGSQRSPEGVPFEVIEQIRDLPQVRAVNVVGSGPGLPSGTRMAGDSGIVVTGTNGLPLQTGSSGAHPLAGYPSEQVVGAVPQLHSGKRPGGPDEVMINTAAAERGEIGVGDIINVLTPTDRLRVRVSGIYDTSTETPGWVGVVFTPERYLELFTAGEHASQIVISVHEGQDPMAVRNYIGINFPQLTPLLPEQIVERSGGQFAQQLEFLRYILVVFGAIALLVGAFNIANTFAMIVGQRTREFALLRSIGVSTGQIVFSVIMEAAAVGLLGSVLGILTALVLVAALARFLADGSGDLTAIEFAPTPGSVVLPLAFGVLVTMISAFTPANRAGKLPPVSALELADARATRPRRIQLLIAGLLSGLGIVAVIAAALVFAINNSEITTSQRLSLTGAGAVLLFLAVATAGPSLISAVGNTFGVVLTAPVKDIGLLARRNTTRNPRRSAATALSLAMAVALVSTVSIIGTTTKASVFGLVESTVKAPFILEGLGGSVLAGQRSLSGNGLTLPAETTQRAEWTSGVAAAGTLMTAPLRANNWDNPQTTVVDDDFSRYLDLGIREGAPSAENEAAVMISATYAQESGLRVGDTISVGALGAAPDSEVTVPIEAIYTEVDILGHMVINYSVAQELVGGEADFNRLAVFLDTDGSASPNELRRNLNNTMAELLVVQIKSREEFGGSLGTQLNQLLTIIYGLLTLSVVIAAMGIINTLLLSVTERIHEIGTLRAVGVRRNQIRRMIQLESLILTVHGAALGITVGTFTGWSVVEVLGSKGMAAPEIPWPQIALTMLGAILVGMAASVVPAMKAAATPPLEAINR
ncbi:putative ABC transporter permease YknZ [Corynebacterium occultum]|uniref:Putative ABC transporter permease YknZ n=1 Tax=Corynebacterium occultum TaxID=2675219 RepID=A0A6B8W8L9_9CORY|nr:putative ABC transporter permease YknZ [Corynebacterium occultum]